MLNVSKIRHTVANESAHFSTFIILHFRPDVNRDVMLNKCKVRRTAAEAKMVLTSIIPLFRDLSIGFKCKIYVKLDVL